MPRMTLSACPVSCGFTRPRVTPGPPSNCSDPTSGSRTLTIHSWPFGEACRANPSQATTDARPGVTFKSGTSGRFYVVVTSGPSGQGAFQLRMHRRAAAPRNATYGDPGNLDVTPGNTVTYDNDLSTQFSEAEYSLKGWSPTWFTVSSPDASLIAFPRYTLTLLAPLNGRREVGEATIEVFQDSRGHANTGTLVATTSGGVGTSLSWNGPGRTSGTFYIRVRSQHGYRTGDFRLRIARAAE